MIILYKDENLTIDESDCGLDFFAPPDGRYKYRPKKERKNTGARDSSALADCDLLDLDSYPSRTFDTSVSAASQNMNQTSKYSQYMLNFQPYRV